MRREQSRKSLFGWLLSYVIANSILFALFSLRYLAVGAGLEGLPAGIFFGFMSLGHMAALALLSVVPAALTILLYPSLLLAAPLAVLALTTLAVFLLLDTQVFQLYRFHINGAMLEMFFGEASKEIFVFSNATYWKLAVLVAAVVAAEIGIAAMLWWKHLTKNRLPLTCGFTLVVLLLHHFAYAFADVRSFVPVTRQAGLLPAYFPTTLRRLYRSWGFAGAEAEPDIHRAAGASSIQYPLRALECAGPAKPTNVLFILIDSWRYDMLNSEVSPELAKFSSRASIFQKHSSGGSATRTGVFTLFYGIPADYWHPFLHERQGPVLIEQFLKNGYEMGIFGSASLTSPEFNQTVFEEVPNLRLRSEGAESYQRDENITEHFLRFLERRNREKPFFGFLFYDAPHAFSVPPGRKQPFEPTLTAPPDYLALNSSYDPRPFFNLYKNAIRFDDELIGRVLAAVEKANLLENTIVLITGDHGQEFNETGKDYWGHSGNFTRYQIGVPFAVWWPGKMRKDYSHSTNHIDVAPTLLVDLFRCGNPLEDYSLGQNLFLEEERKFFLMANYGERALVQADRMTLIHSYGGVEEVDLNLNSLRNQTHDPAMMKEFFRMQSAFLKR